MSKILIEWVKNPNRKTPSKIFEHEMHCTVVIEVIFLFRVARDVFYPLVQDYPKTSQNILIEK